jgi:hypothetical protein
MFLFSFGVSKFNDKLIYSYLLKGTYPLNQRPHGSNNRSGGLILVFKIMSNFFALLNENHRFFSEAANKD